MPSRPMTAYGDYNFFHCQWGNAHAELGAL